MTTNLHSRVHEAEALRWLGRRLHWELSFDELRHGSRPQRRDDSLGEAA